MSSRSAIVGRYRDALGKWHQTPDRTRASIMEAMGQPNPGPDPVIVVRRGQRKHALGPAEMTLEDGAVVRVEADLPHDLPLGYHTLRYLEGGETIRLIVTPETCHLPEGLRVWGWSVQAYSVRSSLSWGMGDLADLRHLGRWSAKELGAEVLLINPIYAASPLIPQQPSPYFPISRSYRNLLYLRIEEITGASELGLDLQRLAEAGKALNAERRIDRNAVFRLKMSALELLWSHFGGDPAFERFCAEQGDSLARFASFCVLAERHGSGWHRWPVEYQRPDAPAVTRLVAERRDRARFYQWVQWLLDAQLAKASAQIPLMQDLPIGVDPDGADAWIWQDVFASGVTVGSPPDEFNTRGQNWGFRPFVPWKLRNAGYEPFIQTLRANLRHAGGLRIDHVMGMFRLFWIPEGADPAMGAYVRYAADEMLAILALESRRAGAYIVGEDLGTVEQSVRKRLAGLRILSYRLLWFETSPPSEYPELSLAAVTTHDLPTIAGLWSGSDLDDQRQLGLEPNEQGHCEIRERLSAMAGLSKETPVNRVIERTYRLLAEAPSMIVTATLEDALAVEERPNMPATTDDRRPNWSLALPVPLERLETHDLVRAVARVLNGRRRHSV